MKGMNIQLTKWQTETLSPLFSVAKKGFQSGNVIAIFAQVWENQKPDGLAFMEVRVIDGEQCGEIQAATGVEAGKMPTGKLKNVTILEPCEGIDLDSLHPDTRKLLED